MGCNNEDATIIADQFLRAELRGHASHGMLRIKDYYQLWKAGRINVNPNMQFVHETPSTATLDGDRAIGMIAASKAMEKAIEKAAIAGTGWVAAINSNHFGIAGYYAMMALKHDMIGICTTNANPLVAPVNSVSRILGTNPIAVAIPAMNYPPFVADFATTPIARGKLAVAESKGEKVAFGYVQDKNGNPSDRPEILKEGGSMLPLGGEMTHGGHKGFCLSAIVDIFSSVLGGANFGPFVPPSVAYLPLKTESVGIGTGHFFGAMRIDAFRPADDFKRTMDKWIETIHNAQPVEGIESVLVPGEVEREKEKYFMKEGLSIIPRIKEELKIIAEDLDIPFE